MCAREGKVLKRLNETLRQYTLVELQRAVAAADSGKKGALRLRELRAALRALSFRCDDADAEDILEWFDDGTGAVPSEQLLEFASASGSGDAGSGAGPLPAIVCRVRGMLLAFGDGAVGKLFKEAPTGRLTVPALLTALRVLGGSPVTSMDIASIVAAAGGELGAEEASVSAEQLEAFLGQTVFARTVRRIMTRGAAALRSNGASLQAALRAAAGSAGGRGPHRPAAGTLLPLEVLKSTLVDVCGFPLTAPQLSSIAAMADVEGCGTGDVEEVLFLASEELEEEEEEEEEGHAAATMRGAPSQAVTAPSIGPSRLDHFERAAGCSLLRAGGGASFEGAGGDYWAEEEEGEEGALSALHGLPLSTLSPTLTSPSSSWAALVDAAWQGVQEGGMLECGRVGPALAALGLPLPTPLLHPLLPSPKVPITQAAFRSLVDRAAVVSQGPALHATAEARVRIALGAAARGRPHAGSAPGGLGSAASGQGGLLTRPALAHALLAVQGAGLTGAEAVAVAAHAPGAYCSLSSALVLRAIGEAAEEEEGRAGGGGRRQVSAFSLRSSPSYPFPKGLYPSAPALLAQAGWNAGGSGGEGLDPDVSVPRFLAWLSALSPACTPVCAEGNRSLGAGPTAAAQRAWGALDPVARCGVSRLCAGSVCAPLGSSLYLSLLPLLPSCCRPSRLSPLARSSLALSFTRLTDWGVETDPGGRLTPRAGGPSPALLSASATASIASGRGADGFGIPLRMASLLGGTAGVGEGGLIGGGMCLPGGGDQGSGAPGRDVALRPIGTAGDEAALQPGGVATALFALTGATAIPCPREPVVRARVTGRVVRLALAHVDAEGVQILSNALTLPATWSPTAEDVWTLPSTASRGIALRCDGLRGSAGPAASVLLLEFNMQFGPEADGEEVTAAWGALPVPALLAADGALRLSLLGGSPGASVEVNPQDVSQRRTGLGALVQAVSGPPVPTPIAAMTVSRLSRLKASDRTALYQLPLSLLLPQPLIPAVVALRRGLVSALPPGGLPPHTTLETGGSVGVSALRAAVLEAIVGVPAGLAALTAAVEAQLPAISAAKASSGPYAAVLEDALLGAWAGVVREGGRGSSAEELTRALSGGGGALLQMLGGHGARLAPVDAAECCA